MIISEMHNKTILLDKYGRETRYYTEFGVKQNKNTGKFYVYLNSELRGMLEAITGKPEDLEVFKRYYSDNVETLKKYNLDEITKEEDERENRWIAAAREKA